MAHCVAVNCTNRPAFKIPGLAYFRFPDDYRKSLWVEHIGRPNFTPSPTSYICAVHFEDKFLRFDTQAKRWILSKDAIPSIFPGPEEKMFEILEKRAFYKRQMEALAQSVGEKPTEGQHIVFVDELQAEEKQPETIPTPVDAVDGILNTTSKDPLEAAATAAGLNINEPTGEEPIPKVNESEALVYKSEEPIFFPEEVILGGPKIPSCLKILTPSDRPASAPGTKVMKVQVYALKPVTEKMDSSRRSVKSMGVRAWKPPKEDTPSDDDDLMSEASEEDKEKEKLDEPTAAVEMPPEQEFVEDSMIIRRRSPSTPSVDDGEKQPAQKKRRVESPAPKENKIEKAPEAKKPPLPIPDDDSFIDEVEDDPGIPEPTSHVSKRIFTKHTSASSVPGKPSTVSISSATPKYLNTEIQRLKNELIAQKGRVKRLTATMRGMQAAIQEMGEKCIDNRCNSWIKFRSYFNRKRLSDERRQVVNSIEQDMLRYGKKSFGEHVEPLIFKSFDRFRDIVHYCVDLGQWKTLEQENEMCFYMVCYEQEVLVHRSLVVHHDMSFTANINRFEVELPAYTKRRLTSSFALQSILNTLETFEVMNDDQTQVDKALKAASQNVREALQLAVRKKHKTSLAIIDDQLRMMLCKERLKFSHLGMQVAREVYTQSPTAYRVLRKRLLFPKRSNLVKSIARSHRSNGLGLVQEPLDKKKRSINPY